MQVGVRLQTKGFKLSTSTNVDATLIHAPNSTKHAKDESCPGMKQPKKGNQLYFGMRT